MVTYWQGLFLGLAGLVVGGFGHFKLPKDSFWWPLAVLLSCGGGALAVVSAARLTVH